MNKSKKSRFERVTRMESIGYVGGGGAVIKGTNMDMAMELSRNFTLEN